VFGVLGLEPRVWGSGFKVKGLGVRAQGIRLQVQGAGSDLAGRRGGVAPFDPAIRRGLRTHNTADEPQSNVARTLPRSSEKGTTSSF